MHSRYQGSLHGRRTLQRSGKLFIGPFVEKRFLCRWLEGFLSLHGGNEEFSMYHDNEQA